MLSEAQVKRVWEGMLSAEIRANYFAELSSRFYSRQRWATWATLLFSSGAAITFLAALPPAWNWVRPALAIVTAALSAYTLVKQNQKFAVDASDLHARWNRLSKDYEAIWENVYADDALETMKSLDDRCVELSKSGAAFKYEKKPMLRWEQHVVSHRAAA